MAGHAYWLARAPPAWRDRVEVVAVGMCTVFLSAVRRALPKAQAAVDLFHVVQLAVKAGGDVRRRAVRDKYGRRGKSGGPGYGIRGLLNKNLQNLSPDQFAKIILRLVRPKRGHPRAARARDDRLPLGGADHRRPITSRASCAQPRILF